MHGIEHFKQFTDKAGGKSHYFKCAMTGHLPLGRVRYTPSPLSLLTGDITMCWQTLRIALEHSGFLPGC